MGLNNTVLNSLVQHVVETIVESGKEMDEQINAFAKLTNCVEDIY